MNLLITNQLLYSTYMRPTRGRVRMSKYIVQINIVAGAAVGTKYIYIYILLIYNNECQ